MEIISQKRKLEETPDTIDNEPRKKQNTNQTETRITTDEMSDCLVLLEKLMNLKEPIAEPFNEPVDYVAFNLPTYPAIIKKPMDLGSIKEMLLANTLANPEHFRLHVALVFENAKTFNQENSPIHVLSGQLLTTFNQMWDEMIARWKKEVAERNTENQNDEEEMKLEKDREKMALQEQIDSYIQKIESAKHQINDIRRKRGQIIEQKPTLQPGVVKRVKLKKPAAPLTMRQKEELCVKIGELQEEEQAGLIKLVDPNCDDDSEFTLNFAVLDDTTILNIQKYVQDCLKSRRRRNNQVKKRNRG